MKPNAILTHPSDNVLVVLEKVPAGGTARTADEEVAAVVDVPASHKIARADIQKGDAVVRYGETICHAAQRIEKGAWVHTHNTTGGGA